MMSTKDTWNKLKGRTWSELRLRGGQIFSAYTEQFGLSGKLQTDADFYLSIDPSDFASKNLTADVLFEKFYEISDAGFFPSFREKDKTIELFRRAYPAGASFMIEQAHRITEGKFDLLGYQNLDFGYGFDWHYEPVSGKHIPLKHWKQYDELDSTETGDKKIIWELNRHQHFFTLGAAYLISKDEVFAATFVHHLVSWMEQNPPGLGINWASSLEVALRAISWIWAFQFFKSSPHFTPDIFKRALKFLHLHGRHLEKYLSTYYSPNSHLTGEALGLYFLGTQLSFFQRADHWRKLGEDILFGELDRQILRDGVHFEQSTWYQRYTADFYLQFLILKSLDKNDTPQGVQEGLATKIQRQLDFLMLITRPDGTTPIIGDDDGGRTLPRSGAKPNDFRDILSTGAVLFERGDYKYVARGFSEETLWLLGSEGLNGFKTIREFCPVKTSQGFPEGGYFVMRDGWSETDNYLLVDCGNLGGLAGKHSHADSLAIDLTVAGKSVLVDPGTYTYHESEDLRNYFRSTMAHNTLSVNNESSSQPGGTFGWATSAKSTLHSWISEERFDFFSGSHDGYAHSPNGCARHERNILFLKNDYWIMRDFVETTGQNEFQLNFHFDINTRPEIACSENGSFHVDEKSDMNAGLRLFTFGDNGGWQRKESWVSTSYGKRINAPFLRFMTKGIGSQEFFTFMIPTGMTRSAPEIFETEISGGRGFAIKHRGYWDIFIYSDEANSMIRTEFFSSDFQFLWARLSDGEILPEEYVLVNGSKFAVNDREIINYPQALKFATARRLGSKLNVRTNESLFSVSLPKKSSNVYILKNSFNS